MSAYVNQHALTELFKPLESQPNPVARSEQIKETQADFIMQLISIIERTAYELKAEGWSLEQIADEMDMSVARTKAAVTSYAKRSGKTVPMRGYRDTSNVVDIRSLVARQSKAEK